MCTSNCFVWLIRSLDNLLTTFLQISHLLIRNWKRKETNKDKNKDYGVVDEPSSEQQFCKLDMITFLVWKIWSHSTGATGSYGRLASRRNSAWFLKLYTGWNIWVFTMFNKGTVLIQLYQCSLECKAYFNVDFGGAKISDAIFWVNPYY